MAIGALTETISVHGEVNPINVSDASLGNVISGQQVRALPLEANNVNGLLSLQPGAVYVPNAQVSDSRTGAVLNIDPRSGAVSGAAPTSRTSRSTASTSTTRSSGRPTPAPCA